MSRWESIAVIAENVRSSKTSAVGNVEKALGYLNEFADYNSVIAPTAERARKRAIEIDNKVKNGHDAGRLAGVPFIAKDNFLVFGAETTAASNILKGFQAPYQSTAVEKLEAEGAICIAKANLDAFAHGSSTENSDFMTTLNPYDKNRVPGGSSGGSAAAVALEIAPFALGTDTGGSIRLPASFCGIVGYKPSYGLVSRSGVVAMASSTDCIGPLTRTVEDTALVTDVMSGRDDLDATTIDRSTGSYANLDSPKPLRIGLIKEYFGDGMSKGVREVIEDAIDKIKSDGHTVQEVSLPSLPLALACYYIICPAEVSSNLSRYDGQRYGHSASGAKDLDSSYTASRSTGFGNEAKRRIMIGAYVLSSGYYDAYYQRAQLVRTKIVNDFSKAFEEFDILLGPTAPTTAFKLGEHTSDPLEMYMTDIMTVGANLSGDPAISIPAGVSEELPVGLQLVGKKAHDLELLSAANHIEGLLK